MSGENDNYQGQKVLKGFFWRFAERCGAQGVTFVVSVVLARLLDPEVYGMIALVTVFTTILQVFVDSGMGSALIRKKDADDLDFSTVFYFNLLACGILYLGIFLAAPLIAGFYGFPELTAVVRVLGLTVVVSGVKNVQQAYVSRHMLFRRFFWATLGGTAGAAAVGTVLAYLGYGVWALVAQQLFNLSVDTVILWITVKWRPKPGFSLERLGALFGFGWKMLASALLDTCYNNVRQLAIGKLYSSGDLAFYNRGRQFPDLVVSNINTSIDSVLLPAMADVQDDTGRVREMTRRSIQTSVYAMAPLLVGIICTAPVLVSTVLTDKWLPCIPYLRIFCITYIFYPIHTANLNAIKAMGRSDLFLKLEIMKKGVGLALLLATMRFGVMAMAYSLLVSSVFSQMINAWPNRKLLDYGYREQLRDILPSILLALFMGLAVWGVSLLPLPPLLVLAVQVVFGAEVYLTGSALFGLDAFVYLWRRLKAAAGGQAGGKGNEKT